MRPETPALFAALASAGLLARCDPRHRPIAALLGARLALAGIRYALAPLIVGKPYHGAARWTWAGDVALAGIAWYAAEAWAVWRCICEQTVLRYGDEHENQKSFPRSAQETTPVSRDVGSERGAGEGWLQRKGSHLIGAQIGGLLAGTSGLSTDAVRATGSPRTLLRRGVLLAAALACATVIAWAAYPILRTLPPWWPIAPVALTLAAQLAAVTMAALRRPLPRLSPPVVCAGIVVASTVAEVLAGPWARLQPWRDWYLAAWCDVAALGGIAAVSVWGWWAQRKA